MLRDGHEARAHDGIVLAHLPIDRPSTRPLQLAQELGIDLPAPRGNPRAADFRHRRRRYRGTFWSGHGSDPPHVVTCLRSVTKPSSSRVVAPALVTSRSYTPRVQPVYPAVVLAAIAITMLGSVAAKVMPAVLVSVTKAVALPQVSRIVSAAVYVLRSTTASVWSYQLMGIDTVRPCSNTQSHRPAECVPRSVWTWTPCAVSVTRGGIMAPSMRFCGPPDRQSPSGSWWPNRSPVR